MQDRTLRWVNRGHGLNEFVETIQRCKERGLRLCTHLILGFPGESRAEILATTSLLNRLQIDGLKLHNLHIIKNTILAKLYATGGFNLFSQKEYVTLVVDFLERLTPETVVHRLTGETYRAITIAPQWSINKIGVHNAIYKELEERDSWQGKLYPSYTEAPEPAGDTHDPGGVLI
jgi:radical SAM protein (TIGR01212 family)